MKKFVNYIMNVYLPLWFVDKKKYNFTNGSKHFFSIKRSTQKLFCAAHISVVTGYCKEMHFMRTLKILIAIILNHEQCVKKLRWRKTFKSRTAPSCSVRQRILKIPKLQFNFVCCFEMIDCQKKNKIIQSRNY